MQTQRSPRSPVITKIRSLTEADVALLRQKSAVPAPQKMRESYHWVCYLLATGMTQNEVAEKTGYSASRISILANSPALREQVAVYRREILQPKIASEVEELKTMCGHKAYRHLHDQICAYDDDEQLMPIRECLATIKTIHGNSGSTVNVNVGFAARLEQAVASTRRLESDVDA